MSKPKKKDWLELIDEKLNELELRTEKLEKYVKQANEFIVEDMKTYFKLILHVMNVAFERKLKLSAFDEYFEKIESREKALQKINTEIKCLHPIELIDGIIWIAKQSKIPFEQLAPYLIQKLGKKLAKKLVRKESMLEDYGKEGLKIWETLLKK